MAIACGTRHRLGLSHGNDADADREIPLWRLDGSDRAGAVCIGLGAAAFVCLLRVLHAAVLRLPADSKAIATGSVD